MPTISTCVLVKNDPRLLDDTLRSARPHSDELIVVDNGSTDDTVAVARSYGAVVIDGSALELDRARRLYVEAAQGDWLLVVDVDEILDETGWASVKAEIASAPEAVAGFRIQRLDYYGRGQWATVHPARLWRNRRGIVYSDQSMHASVAASLNKAGEVKTIAGPLHHIDLLLGRDPTAKRARYRALMQQEFTRDADLLAFLGLECAAIRDYPNAFAYWEQAIAKGAAVDHCRLHMADIYLNLGEFDRAADICRSLIAGKFHRNDRAFVVLAECMVQLGNRAEAMQCIARSVELAPFAASNLINRASLLVDSDPEACLRDIEKAIALNPYLLNPLIYRAGATPNLYDTQHSFLSTASDIFTLGATALARLGLHGSTGGAA